LTQVKNQRGIFPHTFSMFGTGQQTIVAAPWRCRRPAEALLRRDSRILRPLGLLLALALLLAGAIHGPASSYDGQTTTQSVAAGWPSDHPCGTSDGSGHDHAFCSASAACPICAPVEALAAAGRDRRTMLIVRTDSTCGDSDPLSPFHPPKLLVIT